MRVKSYAPGRVILMGTHTDYTGGLVLTMAIDKGTTVAGERRGMNVVVRSKQESGEVSVPLNLTDPASTQPDWGRYVAGMVAALRPTVGFTGEIDSTLPVGAGLSSSAALEVALALAFGWSCSHQALALAGQWAERIACGVPCGSMDQLTSAAGIAGHGLLIDCFSLAITPVRIPEGLAVFVVDSGERRSLTNCGYIERRGECEKAESLVGPLRLASADDVASIEDPVLRRRARHVVRENARVLAMAEALRSNDALAAGRLLTESHVSLRDDFEVSTPRLDTMVEHVLSISGVFGACLSGAGFGGCAIVLAEPGTSLEGWEVRASNGAFIEFT